MGDDVYWIDAHGNLHLARCIILALISALSCTISFLAAWHSCGWLYLVFDRDGVGLISSLARCNRDQQNCGKSHFQLPGKPQSAHDLT
jgi:hypothetical protein